MKCGLACVCGLRRTSVWSSGVVPTHAILSRDDTHALACAGAPGRSGVLGAAASIFATWSHMTNIPDSMVHNKAQGWNLLCIAPFYNAFSTDSSF